MGTNNNTLMVVFIAGIILIAVILVLNQAQVNVVTGGEQQNAISVSGNAELEVEPDQAEVYVRVETLAENAQDAKNENAEISEDVRKALKKIGIKDEDMETTSFYISPMYDYDRIKGESILKGYTVTNVLKVTTNKIEDAGKIIDTAVNNGANSIQGVNFGLSEDMQKEMFGEALIRASKVAKEKAESLANSLGVNLGKVVAVQESNFNFVPFAAPLAMEETAVKAGAATEITPGKVEVRASVTVSYEIK